MRITILIGGKAGQGPNIVTQIAGEALVKQGYYVFCSREYESLIRGGHNFNILTVSDSPVYSNESKIDILAALDENTEKTHKNELKKSSIILKGTKENMHFAGQIFKILGMKFESLENELKKLRNFEENLKNSKQGYESEKKVYELEPKKVESWFMNGSQGIAEGSIKSGLDIYYSYPMTPATPILFELGGKQIKDNFLSLELENETAVMNAACGSAITGAKAMAGSSGGGFDLMTEALSMAGQAEIPVVVYIAQRPGPSTGVATGTSQGDLRLALHSGHGEFLRIVAAPGEPKECQELTSQMFYLSQKFKIPCIILSDKHLAESFYTLEGKPELVKSEKSTDLARYNSYEHNATGEAVENAEIVKKNVEKRLKKEEEARKEAEKFETFKVHGKKQSKNLVIGWGSTKGAILDAIKELDAKFLQILYLEPFSKKIEKELAGKNIIIVENNATSLLSDLIREKTGILIENKNKILRYDGRPFFSDELKKEIEARVK